MAKQLKLFETISSGKKDFNSNSDSKSKPKAKSTSKSSLKFPENLGFPDS